ncbi:sensor histidine kinase [Georgenia sp. SUBG003]|uniref:sensor histidine kinase n=1 Tax=Georgenia sp. SUBG003 TaxID=1497974 RepID=UPI0005BC92EF
MVSRLHGRWRAVSLSARLVAIITTLLLVGLTAAALVTVTVLRANLVGQVDRQLEASAHDLAQRTVDQLTGSRPLSDTSVLPSEYYVRVQVTGVGVEELMSPRTAEEVGRPRLGDVDLGKLSAADAEPVSVPGDGGEEGHVRWRATTMPLRAPGGSQALGAVTVALPMVGVDETLARTSKLITLSALVIVGGGGLAAWVAVRRSLAPLREIEATAGAIADGDLSRRVPALPATTEVGSVARSLNVMLAQIEESFAARTASEQRMRRFVSDASHELRTPLSTIRGYGELYRMGGVPPERLPQAMGRIESEATRMGNLVEDLLQLARLDEGRPLVLSDVDLTTVARDSAADLHAQAPDRMVTVVPLDGGGRPGPVVVRADRDRISQVVANLVGNVLQHTPVGTPVEIGVGTLEPGWAQLEVRDHGPGIAAEDARRVFERFYRVDPSRTRSSGGSGLGLAIVASIVGAHGGAVRVVPTPGGGTTVQVALPVGEPPPTGAPPHAGAESVPPAATEPAPPAGSGTKVPRTP